MNFTVTYSTTYKKKHVTRSKWWDIYKVKYNRECATYLMKVDNVV